MMLAYFSLKILNFFSIFDSDSIAVFFLATVTERD